MTRPGSEVTIVESAPTRSVPTDDGTWFVVGATTSGSTTEPTLVKSLSEFTDAYGIRLVSDPTLYDSLDAFFREGGYQAYVARVAATELDADYEAALALFTKDLGPGQVSIPGNTDTQVRTAILAHCATMKRVAFLDVDSTADAAANITAGEALQSETNGRWSGLFGPWATIPGLTAGTERTIPYSAIAAGIVARNQALGLGGSVPAAGSNGQSRYATGLAYTYTDAEREDLNDAGVNVARFMLGGVRTYGWRSGADPQTLPQWLNLGHVRLAMEIAAKCDNVDEEFMFEVIDGQRHKVSAYGGALIGVIQPYYDSGQLYGETANEAFTVDVGPTVNTDASLATNTLKAKIALKMSPFAEKIELELAKVGITESFA